MELRGKFTLSRPKVLWVSWILKRIGEEKKGSVVSHGFRVERESGISKRQSSVKGRGRKSRNFFLQGMP